MGLINITGILTLILIFDALRNKMSTQMKHNCVTRRRKKKKHIQEENQITQNNEESENIWDNTTYDFQSEESESSKYTSIKNNSGRNPLLPIKEKNHYVEQEIKDLQGTVKSPQKEIATYYPITQN